MNDESADMVASCRPIERLPLLMTSATEDLVSDPRRRALVGTLLASLAGCGGGREYVETTSNALEGSTGPLTDAAAAPTPLLAAVDTSAQAAVTSPAAPADPGPAPKSADDAIRLQTVALDQLVIFEAYHKDSRYERFHRLQVLTGDRATIPIQAFSLAGGGLLNKFKGARYTLLVDQRPAATLDVPAGTSQTQFDLDLTALEPGWRRLDVGGLTGGETCPTWWAFVKRGAIPPPTFTPVVRGTYELVSHPDSQHAWASAPAAYNPTPRPLARREAPTFGSALPRSEMTCTQLVPMRSGDVHRTNVNQDGIVSSFDTQAYFWSDMVARVPRVPLLDGARGIGTVCMVTHVEIGTAAPQGVPRNNLYVCDPWRVCKVSEDGAIKTLVGYRHRSMLRHWEDPPEVELVGDWSAIPEQRRGFHELWGLAWDERTLAINTSAPPIPAENNEQPHITGPVMFVSDSQNNRVCKIAFSATSHTTPAKVTEFITDIFDPWDIVYDKGVLYVTERQSHRIAAYDAATGAYLRTLVQGRALAAVDRNREVARAASLTDIQAEPCVAPEGLYKLDGWLYFASKAQGQVKRISLATGELQLVATVPMDDNSKFCKLAIGDGTFGPRGTVFTWTFSNGQYGLPASRLPDGSTFWLWYEQDGGAGQWSGFNYATAGAVGQGRLVSGGVNEGLLLITKKQSADPVASAAAIRGSEEFRSRALHLLHGQNGFGFYGLALPWGVSSDIDAYLELHGHRRT